MLNFQALHAAITDEANTLELVKASGEVLALRIQPRRRRYRAAAAVAAVKAEGDGVELVRVLSKDGAVLSTLRAEVEDDEPNEQGQVMLDPYARAVEVVDAIYQRAYAAARESFTAALTGSSKAVEVMSVALTRSNEVMVIAQERQREAQDAQIEAVRTAAAAASSDPNILEFIKELPAMMPLFLQMKQLVAPAAAAKATPAPPPAAP